MVKETGNKSRKERRKEARLDKNKKKFDSWVQHHQLQKKKKSSKNQKTENMQKNTQIREEKELINLSETSSPNELKESKHTKRKKNLQVNDDYMDMESDKDDISENEDLKLETKHSKKLKVKDKKSHALDDDDNTKKKKTKFEKYLEFDKHADVASANEDLALERKLAKKLKIKKGKLGGDDDELNMLFDGISSVFDSLESEETSIKKEKTKKKRKKQKVDEDVVQEDEPEHELDSENNHEQETMKVGQQKYVPPQLRSLSKNEMEEYSQVRKRVRGLLNRLSESNVEGITSEMATIFQEHIRSSSSQDFTPPPLISKVNTFRGITLKGAPNSGKVYGGRESVWFYS